MMRILMAVPLIFMSAVGTAQEYYIGTEEMIFRDDRGSEVVLNLSGRMIDLGEPSARDTSDPEIITDQFNLLSFQYCQACYPGGGVVGGSPSPAGCYRLPDGTEICI